ncbi:MAG: type II toxin-antitoxin system RelE/ParE family toxin [Prolixibacteraceae bacterium]|nr:type II toxin-antitoxin system RelE/ParE family toxin [Prolixibacteraceae bacterium]
MSYKVKTIPYFDRQAKRLTRKYASFKNELEELFNSLEDDPTQGTALGNDCFKIRVKIKSKGKGKSGGARTITHVIAVREHVYLLTVYDKSEKDYISDKELQELLKMIK